MKTIETRVARGAARLDQDLPGWENKVGLERLDIISVDTCILGQCYGTYSDGLLKLRIDVSRARALGFHPRSRSEAQALRESWRHFVEARREAKP